MKSTMIFQISEGSVKFLHIDSNKKILQADIVSTGSIEEALTTQNLKNFIQQKRLKFRGARVIVVIPRSRAILRRMNLPSHQDDELRSMAALQGSGHVPYAREDVEMDFQVLRKSSDGYAQVMAVVAPKEIMLKWWKIFSEAGIPVDCMTVSSVGLWLLCSRQPALGSKLAGIIDVDSDHTEICFCYKEHWLNAREIPLGFKQMQDQGAAELLKQWDLSCTQLLNEKVTDPISAVFLAGQAERVPSLKDQLAQQQGFAPVSIMLERKPAKFSGPVSWAASMGIAMGPAAVPINLMPQEIRNMQAQRSHRRELKEFLGWIAAAFILLAVSLSMGIINKNIELGSLKKKFEAAKKDSGVVEEQLRKIREIEDLFKNRRIFAEWIKAIYQILPPQLSLVSMTLSNEKILSLQGIAANATDISKLQEGMINSPLFAKVNLDYVNKRVIPEGEVNYFKITCVIKPEKGANEKTQ